MAKCSRMARPRPAGPRPDTATRGELHCDTSSGRNAGRHGRAACHPRFAPAGRGGRDVRIRRDGRRADRLVDPVALGRRGGQCDVRRTADPVAVPHAHACRRGARHLLPRPARMDRAVRSLAVLRQVPERDRRRTDRRRDRPDRRAAQRDPRGDRGGRHRLHSAADHVHGGGGPLLRVLGGDRIVAHTASDRAPPSAGCAAALVGGLRGRVRVRHISLPLHRAVRAGASRDPDSIASRTEVRVDVAEDGLRECARNVAPRRLRLPRAHADRLPR